MKTPSSRPHARTNSTGWTARLLAALLWALPALSAANEAYLRIETGQHTAIVNKLAVDAHGTLLATASDDKTVRLWSLPGGLAYATLRVPIGPGKKGSVYAVALSPDGKTVAAAGETGDFTIDDQDAAEASGGANKPLNYALYLFDAEKRVMKGRLSGLPSTIRHLAYSKDGQRLAAAFSGGNGIKVWSAKDGKLLGEDPSYEASCTWLDFDRQGNLATVSGDGKVRLYSPDLKLIKQAQPRAQAKPYSIEYSSGGDRLAVGYLDLAEVDILGAADLKTVKSLKAQGLKGDNAGVVAWQPNGSGGDALLAGGNLRDGQERYVLRRWQNPVSDQPTATDIPVASNTLTDIAALDSDAVDLLFASADPSWGGVKNAGLAYKNQSGQWDARVAELEGNSIRLSEDGLTVDYPVDARSGKRMMFDVRQMQLEAAAPGTKLAPPLTESKAYKIAQWRRPGDQPRCSNQPSFNGKPLALEKGECAYGLAIDRTRGGFLLGTEYHLRLYDAQGKELGRSAALTAPAYSVNLAGNGKLAVAALGDGTLHWYALDGSAPLEELVALFPYDHGKRWLTWTREGFFGHSERGGDNLAGYHIDKGGSKRPEWVEFSQLYQAYYAPELVTNKLLGDLAPVAARLAAIDQAPQRLSAHPLPGIELAEFCLPGSGGTKGFARIPGAAAPAPAAPATSAKPAKPAAPATPAAPAAPAAPGCQPIAGQGQTRGFVRKEEKSAQSTYRNSLAQHQERVKLRYKVTVREGGLGNIDVYVNGKIQESRIAPRPAPQNKAVLDMESELLLADGGNQIVVQAYEQTGGASEKSTLVDLLNPPLATAGQPPAKPSKPKLIVGAVGIKAYPTPNQLKNAAKDAADFAATVEKYKSDAYGQVVKFEVFDEQATGANIDRMFSDIQQVAGPEDTVLVYLSGHGLREDMNYYFIPVDVDSNDLPGTALSQERMKQNIAKLGKVSRVFLFIDSCHSGAFQLADLGAVDQEISGQAKLKRHLGENLFVLAASREDQEALDESGVGSQNGLFAYAVLEGLKGSARRQDDNVVDNYNLGGYVQRRVDALSNRQNFKQKAKFQKAESGEIEPFDITKAVY
jgi:hypothetical protein